MDDCFLEVLAERYVVDLELRSLTPNEAGHAAELIRALAAANEHVEQAEARAAYLGLSRTEVHVLGMLAAIALFAEARQAVIKLSGYPDPTIEIIRCIVYGDRSRATAFRELGERGLLRRLALIERSDGGGVETHETRRTWAISAYALQSLLEPTASPVPRSDEGPALCVAPQTLGLLADAVGCSAIVNVADNAASGRRTMTRAVSREHGLELAEADARTLPKDTHSFITQLRAIARECRLLGRVPLLCNIDALVDDKDTTRLDVVGSELVPLIDGPVLVTCGVNRPKLDWGRPVIVVEMGQPTTAQRAQLWHQALGQGTHEDADLLATRYPLAPALIVRAAEAAKARAHGRTLAPDDIYAGIRAVLDDRLGQYAKRVTVTQTWDDLVLPEEQVDAVVELMARIRERRRVYEEWGFAAKVGKGLGVSALFSGPPGTGKTMVAALIARDLGLELYQVDVSKLVSKYIGETEKHLAALFDAAEAGHAVLLFDEADALFGKRTDVKSSNDRYANLETNYLLQRLESFTGICLLTSNHESHIDPAFQRRLSLHLRFDLPDAEQRAALWRAMLPDAAPVAPTADLDGLGRKYAMSGGYIRNAALRAAFLAANDGTAISAHHLERAARLEYEGMGKIASN